MCSQVTCLHRKNAARWLLQIILYLFLQPLQRMLYMFQSMWPVFIEMSVSRGILQLDPKVLPFLCSNFFNSHYSLFIWEMEYWLGFSYFLMNWKKSSHGRSMEKNHLMWWAKYLFRCWRDRTEVKVLLCVELYQPELWFPYLVPQAIPQVPLDVIPEHWVPGHSPTSPPPIFLQR